MSTEKTLAEEVLDEVNKLKAAKLQEADLRKKQHEEMIERLRQEMALNEKLIDADLESFRNIILRGFPFSIEKSMRNDPVIGQYPMWRVNAKRDYLEVSLQYNRVKRSNEIYCDLSAEVREWWSEELAIVIKTNYNPEETKYNSYKDAKGEIKRFMVINLS
jgi:hypothetical protein